MRHRHIVFLVLLVLLGPSVGAQEFSPLFSGGVSAEAGDQPGSLHAVVDMGFDARWEALSGQFIGGASLKEGRPTWDLTHAWLEFSAEAGGLKAGVWPDGRGPAQFRSLVPGFTTGSGTEFLATAGTATPPSPGKVVLKLVTGEWSWTGEVSPWRPAPSMPDTTSPWFPRKDVPTSIPGLLYPLRAIRTVAVPSEVGWERWPVRSELRWLALWGDISVGGYHGIDTQAFFPLRLIYAYDPNLLDVFDLVLTPRLSPVSMVWLTLEVPVAAGTLWTEQRLTKDRPKVAAGYLLVPGGQTALDQNTTTSDVWEGLWGGAYSLSAGSWGQVRMWTEASVYRDMGTPEKKAPDFTAGWVGGVSWEESRGLGSLDVLAGTPWDPVQGWLWARATWNWMEGRTLWLGVPVFWGAADTAWGQFASRRVWALGTTWDQ